MQNLYASVPAHPAASDIFVCPRRQGSATRDLGQQYPQAGIADFFIFTGFYLHLPDDGMKNVPYFIVFSNAEGTASVQSVIRQKRDSIPPL